MGFKSRTDFVILILMKTYNSIANNGKLKKNQMQIIQTHGHHYQSLLVSNCVEKKKLKGVITPKRRENTI